jgi:hypothetical protein
MRYAKRSDRVRPGDREARMDAAATFVGLADEGLQG